MFKFDKTVWEGKGLLLCPSCGFNYTFHDRIDISIREKEDAEHGLHILVLDGMVTTDSHQRNNPSPRRNGLSIEFECEDCEKNFYLIIEQHKGQTFFSVKVRE